MRYPDFISIGAQKAGTTWLFEQLRIHPQVFFKKKELDYFVSKQSPAWYADQFRDASTKVCGDVSPNYSAIFGVAQKIHELCPATRIVYLLRDPVKRAYSQWKMVRARGKISSQVSFMQAFDGNIRHIRSMGEYATYIEEYAGLFPLGRTFLVAWHADIGIRPQQLMREVQEFIGVDPDWKSPHLSDVINASEDTEVISAADYEAARDYYRQPDRRLREVLGVLRLPWDR